nr:phospholipase-like protein [Tanacetum cinerariifolium]
MGSHYTELEDVCSSPHIDRVKAFEGLCDSLMILPKEIKSLKARVYKLETIINDLNQNHKDSTSGKQCDLGDKYWSDQDGEPFFKYMDFTNPSAKKDALNDLVDALDDLVDELFDYFNYQWFCLWDDFLKAQKLEAKKNRVAEQKRLRLQLMLEEANSRKGIDFSKSSHMKVAIERCGTNKRRQSCDDWSMVSCYFLTLLLQDSMPLFYATDEIYPLAWRDVEQVFIPINEPKRHWSLAQFHILEMSHSMTVKILTILNVIPVSHGIPLDVEDPI